MKKSERKGRRSFDTAIEYGTVAIIGTEKTRTAESARRPASWNHTAGRPKAMGRGAAARATCLLR